MNKIIANPHSDYLAESFQANEIKFSFVNPTKDGDWQVLHSWAKCREYFNEILMANHHPNEFTFQETYGMRYRYNEYPMDMNFTYLGVKFQSSDVKQKFLDNLKYVHRVEEINGVDLTEVIQTNETNVVVLKASRFWIMKCIAFNLYSQIVKLAALGASVLTMKELAEIRMKYSEVPSEVMYIQGFGEKAFNKLLHNITVLVETPTKYVDGTDEIRGTYQVHGTSGIMALKAYISSDLYPELKALGSVCKSILNGKDCPSMFGFAKQ